MFDYERFENDLVQKMLVVFNNWIEQNHDLYIFSLDCARGMESIGAIANTTQYLKEKTKDCSSQYFFYKYCEEEWDLFHIFRGITAAMNKYVDENDDVFSDPETFEYTEIFDEHCEKMIEHCINALIRLRKSMSQNHSDILLTFNIREYLGEDDRIEIFEKINSKNATKEYSEHIKEFN